MIWCVTNANGRCWLWRHIRMKLQAYVLVVCIITTYHFTPRSSVQSWNLLHYTEVLHTSNFCRHMKGKKTSVAIWCLVSVDIFIILHKYLTCSDVHAGCNWRGYYQGCTLLGKGCWTSCELCQPVTKYNMPRWLVWKWWGKWNTKIIHKQNMYWGVFSVCPAACFTYRYHILSHYCNFTYMFLMHTDGGWFTLFRKVPLN